MQKTRSEIMAETFAAYANPKNRGLSSMGQCQYLTKGGKMCAVGRCMIDPGNKDYINQASFNPYGADMVTITYDEINNLDEQLKDGYRGHSSDFWGSLQLWHDTETNFEDNEISQRGLFEIERMKRQWSE